MASLLRSHERILVEESQVQPVVYDEITDPELICERTAADLFKKVMLTHRVPLPIILSLIETAMVKEAMRKTNTRTKQADVLGVSIQTVCNKIARKNIKL